MNKGYNLQLILVAFPFVLVSMSQIVQAYGKPFTDEEYEYR